MVRPSGVLGLFVRLQQRVTDLNRPFKDSRSNRAKTVGVCEFHGTMAGNRWQGRVLALAALGYGVALWVTFHLIKGDRNIEES